MKILKVLAAITGFVSLLMLVCIGVRLVPGAVVFALARDMALDFGLDSYAALAVALILGSIPVVFFIWRGFSWRKFVILVLTIPLVLALYFAAKSYVHTRAGDVSNPDAMRWFGKDGQPLLYYVRQPGGSLIFSARHGFHYRTGQLLQPVTAEIYREWRHLKGRQDKEDEENAALKAKLARQLIEVDQLRQEKEEKTKEGNKLLQELKETRDITAQVRNGLEKTKQESEDRLVRQTLEDEHTRQCLEAQIRASEDRLRQEMTERAEAENELGQQKKAARRLKSGIRSKTEPAEDQQHSSAIGSPQGKTLSTATPAPKGAVVTIQIKNATRFRIYVCFSSPESHRAWQSPGCAWIAEAGQTIVLTLSGFSGERVFYNAWAAHNPGIRWGRGSGEQGSLIAICGENNPPLFALMERQ